MVALNERHGATPAPVGAIFLIGFGHGLHDTDQSAMHLGGGQFWASYLIPCSILSGCAFRPNRIRGFRSQANGGGWDIAAEAGSGPPSVAALRFLANPLRFVSALHRPLANQAALQVKTGMAAAGTEGLALIRNRLF
jgi:hypothetical protein